MGAGWRNANPNSYNTNQVSINESRFIGALNLDTPTLLLK